MGYRKSSRLRARFGWKLASRSSLNHFETLWGRETGPILLELISVSAAASGINESFYNVQKDDSLPHHPLRPIRFGSFQRRSGLRPTHWLGHGDACPTDIR